MGTINKNGIFCSSSNNLDESYYQEADRLGRWIGSHGLTLVCGGAGWSIYHCGFLYMKAVFKEEGNGENLPVEVKKTVDRIIKQDKANEEYIAFVEKCFHKAIEMQIQDKSVLDFLEKHLQEAYYLIRKGRYWWINNKHEDAKDEKLLNDHIRNEYFRLVMMDPLMQRSIIVEENKKVGLLLFHIGITVSRFLPLLPQ